VGRQQPETELAGKDRRPAAAGNRPADAPLPRGPATGARDWSRRLDLLRIILAILLPPLGVFLQVGLGGQFWLNILLTLLGYIPGIVHAVWIIAKR
jgi:uncharacterized membrane protein YqaE (UPF0057 family)